jgi:hypothetical protein
LYARALFETAEAIQAKERSHEPWLYSVPGYHYWDLLLDQGCAAEVRERAAWAFEIAERNHLLLDIALNHLTLGRAAQALGDQAEAPGRSSIRRSIACARRVGSTAFPTD